MVKKRTCVFISGKGSNLKNLINKSRESSFPVTINLVISNNKNAKGNIYAKKFNIPLIIINSNLKSSDNKILYNLTKYKISLICLAGYMKIISNKIVNNFQKKIINIHPSLLPKFKGLNTFSKVLKNKEKKTGCSVHFVNNKLDDGSIIIKRFFYLSKNESEKTLKQKTQILEYKAYPEAIIKIFRNR
jgi:formyltetrahydrofolate-dependent phosphoribosylglycinamide formyltransferase